MSKDCIQCGGLFFYKTVGVVGRFSGFTTTVIDLSKRRTTNRCDFSSFWIIHHGGSQSSTDEYYHSLLPVQAVILL